MAMSTTDTRYFASRFLLSTKPKWEKSGSVFHKARRDGVFRCVTCFYQSIRCWVIMTLLRSRWLPPGRRLRALFTPCHRVEWYASIIYDDISIMHARIDGTWARTRRPYKSIRISKPKSSTHHITGPSHSSTAALLSSHFNRNKMVMKQFALRIVALCALLSMAESLREHRRFAGISNIQRLHEMLEIDTSDPREDIRTNILLNMEGF